LSHAISNLDPDTWTLTPPKPMNAFQEISHKLTLIRQALEETEATGIRLRGTDWFAWSTAGGSNTVFWQRCYWQQKRALPKLW